MIISISDNGSGIKDEYADLIFDPFFTTKPTADGVGLGLFLAHEILSNNKGSIALVKSNSGACFNISVLVNINAEQS